MWTDEETESQEDYDGIYPPNCPHCGALIDYYLFEGRTRETGTAVVNSGDSMDKRPQTYMDGDETDIATIICPECNREVLIQ